MLRIAVAGAAGVAATHLYHSNAAAKQQEQLGVLQEEVVPSVFCSDSPLF